MAEREQSQKSLVNRRGRSNSFVWEHFGFEDADVDQKHFMCKICCTVVLASLGNTTNLFNHLKFKHRPIYDQLIKKKQQTTPTTSSATQSSIKDTHFSATPYPSSSERHKKITAAVAHFLAKDMCSISTVDKYSGQVLCFAISTLFHKSCSACFI